MVVICFIVCRREKMKSNGFFAVAMSMAILFALGCSSSPAGRSKPLDTAAPADKSKPQDTAVQATTAPADGSGQYSPEQLLTRVEMSRGKVDDFLKGIASKRIRAVEDPTLADLILILANGKLVRVKDIPRMSVRQEKDLALEALQRHINNNWVDYETFAFHRMEDKNVTVIEPQEAETRRLIALLDGIDRKKVNVLSTLLTGEDFKPLREQLAHYPIPVELYLKIVYESGVDYSTLIRSILNFGLLEKVQLGDPQKLINFARRFGQSKIFEDTAVLRYIIEDLHTEDNQVLEYIDKRLRIPGAQRFTGTYMDTEAALKWLEENKGQLQCRVLANLRGGDGPQNISKGDISDFNKFFAEDLRKLGIRNPKGLLEAMAADGAGWRAVARTLSNLDIAGDIIAPTELNIRSFALAFKNQDYYSYLDKTIFENIIWARQHPEYKSSASLQRFLTAFELAKSSLTGTDANISP
jgi:hypothetical protein